MATAFRLFGINEVALIIFPLIFSVFNLILIYYFTKAITHSEKAALISALLLAFFPTDVAFATIGFPDLFNTFFIYLGLFLLWKAYETRSLWLSVLSGIFFFISMQFKENIYFILILLFLFWLYLLYKKNNKQSLILIPILIILSNIFIEGFIYFLIKNDFSYRLKIIRMNYTYCYYDFFPYTVIKYLGKNAGYWKELFYQIFIINIKSIFLRRFYLFLPLIALISSIINLKEKKHFHITFFFLGLLIIFLSFTASFTKYAPLDLHRSWYIYPLIIPIVILSSIFIMKFKTKYMYLFICMYIIFSLFMCKSYNIYFGTETLSRFTKFLKIHQKDLVYTDHYTGYGINFIEGYKNQNKILNLEEGNFNSAAIPKQALVILNKKHIDELKLQKYKFPNLDFVKGEKYKLIFSSNDYKVFEKTL
jgi:4-amino-4-deoxy-L-arabinose transferase-like glycosyltransferase